MTDEEYYRAVCMDCGWTKESASYHDHPFRREQNARKSLAGHVGQTGCDPSLSTVIEITEQ